MRDLSHLNEGGWNDDKPYSCFSILTKVIVNGWITCQWWRQHDDFNKELAYKLYKSFRGFKRTTQQGRCIIQYMDSVVNTKINLSRLNASKYKVTTKLIIITINWMLVLEWSKTIYNFFLPWINFQISTYYN